MSFSPVSVAQRPPLFVNCVNSSLQYQLRSNSAAAPLSLAWDTANRIHYMPIIIPKGCVLYRTYWLNGATVGTNNLQVGLYNNNDAGTDGPGTAFFRGTSTLSAGTANLCQFVDETDTYIPAGRYWLAGWCNGTTATVFRVAGITSNQFNRNALQYWETNASGLPTTATPVAQSTPFWPIMGFTTIASP